VSVIRPDSPNLLIPAERAAKQEANGAIKQGGKSMDDRKLILVVDDDPDLVEAISMKLASENYRVAKAYDGVQAWDKIKQERPHLIILDVMMPNKNGYQVCKELKNDPQYKNITVVLLTAVGEAVTSTNYTHMDGKTALADEFIPKPIDLDSLMEIVKDYTR
jgi:two-component system alkaline phosphatase synthesis response regulator PhoP